MRKPGFWMGALVGGMATAALIALYFAADALVGLPLVPYDVFDWIARTLPGGVITFGIETMVNVLIALNVNVSEAAKLAEQGMAVAGMWLTGVVAGGVLFAALRAAGTRRGLLPGLLLGLLFGGATLFISLSVNQTAQTGPALNALWILAVTLAWGLVIGWAYERLAAQPAPVQARAAGEELTVEQKSRREFLIRMGASTAAITVVGAGLASVLSTRDEQSAVAGGGAAIVPEGNGAVAPGGDPTLGAAALLNPLPNANARVQPVPGTRPEYTPVEQHYRIDINARPPRIEAETWVLPINGMVDNPLELTLEDLKTRYEPVHRFVTLSCISNHVGGDLIGTTLWTGARLQDVLADAGVQPGARYLTIVSEDGFHESVPLDLIEQDDRIMLAYHWDGQPLTREHGFPLRIWIPDRYGMKQPKWIVGMTVTDEYEPGYWVVRNWDEEAIIRTTSFIDTVATDAAIERDGRMLIPIGGMAHAGARGISRVEVRVDDGEWVEAELRDPLSDTTWTVWRIDWPFEEGAHTIAVRCYDSTGELQITEPNDPYPGGATGIDTLMTAIRGGSG